MKTDGKNITNIRANADIRIPYVLDVVLVAGGFLGDPLGTV
jgi:hypothetical protein